MCPLTMPRKVRFLNTAKGRRLNRFFFFFFVRARQQQYALQEDAPRNFVIRNIVVAHLSNTAFGTFSARYEQNDEINTNMFLMKDCFQNFNYTLHIPGTIIILFSNKIWKKNKFPAKIRKPLFWRFTTISVERCPALIFVCRYFTKIRQETRRFVTT